MSAAGSDAAPRLSSMASPLPRRLRLGVFGPSSDDAAFDAPASKRARDSSLEASPSAASASIFRVREIQLAVGGPATECVDRATGEVVVRIS